ncbi:hypothetical protein JL2886_03540 [Phaeobacter gallaeciensis]|uniref:Uncharacterized protein n=1 Tax=Phaeobacter gallaeciensis TaxID=60890 RepID=A0A1B0ZW43_9RHOB|nr:hypothetical protein JL2886_03540 [Phaeobacter gallaeciensis]
MVSTSTASQPVRATSRVEGVVAKTAIDHIIVSGSEKDIVCVCSSFNIRHIGLYPLKYMVFAMCRQKPA